jgi:hypothetical protein
MSTNLIGASSNTAAVQSSGSTRGHGLDGLGTLDDVLRRFTGKVTVDATATALALAARQQTLADLLPFEVELAPRLAAEIARLEAELRAAKLQLDARFPRIDMGFMKKRGWNLYPAFALFDVTLPPLCLLKLRHDWIPATNRTLDQRLVECSPMPNLMWEYADLEWLRAKVLSTRESIELWTELKGVIPGEVRQLIKQNIGTFDQIAIAAEVAKWNERIGPGDPLVLGRVGPLWWLIAKFDTTPLEEYVAKEFSAGPRIG